MSAIARIDRGLEPRPRPPQPWKEKRPWPRTAIADDFVVGPNEDADEDSEEPVATWRTQDRALDNIDQPLARR
ncbi:UNVERIFIED_CONTAM: hypothetical protein Sradi_6228700 [Sesamum radiatum]|uniref:Uncharacterized protein n=1 Tax=Sesamum radiatum TaxID=300843 RepID=A0AAW2KAU4_SESRA